MPQDSSSEPETDEPEFEFVEIDPTGRYGRVSVYGYGYCAVPNFCFSVSPVFIYLSLFGDFTENYVGFTEFELLLPTQSKSWRTHIKFLLFFTVIGLTSIDTDVNGGGFCSIRRF